MTFVLLLPRAMCLLIVILLCSTLVNAHGEEMHKAKQQTMIEAEEDASFITMQIFAGSTLAFGWNWFNWDGIYNTAVPVKQGEESESETVKYPYSTASMAALEPYGGKIDRRCMRVVIIQALGQNISLNILFVALHIVII